MLRKLLKSLFNQNQRLSYKKYSSSSRAYKRHDHKRYSQMGHGYYKKRRRSSEFFSSDSGFFSS
jgi:hypothetical protein